MGHDDMEVGPEPSLTELLADPLVRLLMQRDRVEPAELERVIEGARQRLRMAGPGVLGGGTAPAGSPDDPAAPSMLTGP